jgi:hypothetical protein
MQIKPFANRFANPSIRPAFVRARDIRVNPHNLTGIPSAANLSLASRTR